MNPISKRLSNQIKRWANLDFIPPNRTKFIHEGDQIYAIKAGIKKGQVRLYGFFFNGGKEFILTNGCIKKKDKANPEDLRTAKNLRDEYLKGAQHHE